MLVIQTTPNSSVMMTMMMHAGRGYDVVFCGWCWLRTLGAGVLRVRPR